MTLAEFTKLYPTQGPNKPHANPDELKLLGRADGVRLLANPPLAVTVRANPRSSNDGCHLWVAKNNAVQFIFELASISPPLQSGRVKHTNLTGGQPAICAGEMWFDPATDDLVYINGCSGRYEPRTRQELDDFVSAVDDFGYKTVSFGWDEDTNKPARVLRV